jgi:hypothetical protein
MATPGAELRVIGIRTAGSVILIVPPPLRTPDGYVPCAAELLGAKDADTGQLPGVTAIRLGADMGEATGDLGREVVAELTEYLRALGLLRAGDTLDVDASEPVIWSE